MHKILLISNPASGRQKNEKKIKKIEKYCFLNNISFNHIKSKYPTHITEICRDVEKYSHVLVMGGDGSINEAINGIITLNKKPILSIIPSGTTNDLAKILKIPKNINKNLKLIFSDNNSLIDINKVGDIYFTYVAALGYLTSVSYDIDSNMKKKFGYLAYIWQLIKQIKKKEEFEIKLTANNETKIIKTPLIFILAARKFGGLNLRNYEKVCKLNDGLIKFHAYNTQRHLKKKLIRFLFRFGKLYKKDYTIISDKIDIEILSDNIARWNFDGENKISGSIKVEVIKKALPITINKKVKKRLF